MCPKPQLEATGQSKAMTVPEKVVPLINVNSIYLVGNNLIEEQ